MLGLSFFDINFFSFMKLWWKEMLRYFMSSLRKIEIWQPVFMPQPILILLYTCVNSKSAAFLLALSTFQT